MKPEPASSDPPSTTPSAGPRNLYTSQSAMTAATPTTPHTTAVQRLPERRARVGSIASAAGATEAIAASGAPCGGAVMTWP